LYIDGSKEGCKNINTTNMNNIHSYAKSLKIATVSLSIILIVIAALIFIVFALAFTSIVPKPLLRKAIWGLFALGVLAAIILGIVFFIYKDKENGLEDL